MAPSLCIYDCAVFMSGLSHSLCAGYAPLGEAVGSGSDGIQGTAAGHSAEPDQNQDMIKLNYQEQHGQRAPMA